MTIHAKVTQGSHFLAFTELSPLAVEVMRNFVGRQLVSYQVVKRNGFWQKEQGKVYAHTPGKGRGIILHINQHDEVFAALNAVGIREDKLEITTLGFDDYEIYPTEYQVKDNFKAYDYQEPLMDYVMAEGHRKLIALKMGLGKTFTVLKIAELMKQRFCVLMLPKYKDKWISDVVSYGKDVGTTNLKDKNNRYRVIDTVDKLLRYLDEIDRFPVGDDVWCILMTITTLIGYIEFYDESDDVTRESLTHPADIWKKMRVGLRITDEAHEHFHRNFIIDLHTHIPKAVYLSATLDPSDKFLAKIYELMYPKRERMGEDIYTPYIKVYPYFYNHNNLAHHRYLLQGKYSHAMYEKAFLKDNPYSNKVRERYFKMIYDILLQSYVKRRREGQRAIVFFGTVKLCTMFCDYLRVRMSDYVVQRYVYEDDYDDIFKADIIVTTPGSAGTAIDIPGLITNIMTISVFSQVLNLQLMGRLRALKQWPDMDPEFYYLVATDIEHSMHYHKSKDEYMKPLAKSFEVTHSGVTI